MLSNDDKKLLLSIINEKINNLESKSKEKYVDMEVAIEFHRTVREYFPNHEPKLAEVSLNNNILDEIKKLKDLKLKLLESWTEEVEDYE